jgi:pyruvate,water dikinase
MEHLMNSQETANVNEILKGLAACVSEQPVIGTAYVLLDFEKVSDFPKGSILITEQTSPECTNAIENSIAVVTQRGGILCHAAIVCRDISIPCIVGVKGLLNHVKTGMMIEVNTQKGVINIIK